MKESSNISRPWRVGKGHSDETKEKIRNALMGRKPKPVSEDTRLKIGIAHKGEKCNWWRGGTTPINKQIRKSLKMKEWRKSIFTRDDYTCQFCGVKGGEIHPDHIKSFSSMIEEVIKNKGLDNLFENAMLYDPLWDINNGRTLCIKCHKTTDTYGVNIKK